MSEFIHFDVDVDKLIDFYTHYRGSQLVWNLDVFDKLTYAELIEIKKRVWQFKHVNVLLDADHVFELARKIERLEQRISDLELRNELSSE